MRDTSHTLSTAAAAEVFIALTVFSNCATARPLVDAVDEQSKAIRRITTKSPLLEASGLLPTPISVISASSIANTPELAGNEIQRPTSLRETYIGELRRWSLLKANWDGEGAAAPALSSVKDAVSFLRLLDENDPLLEPMLLASGNAALYVNSSDLYADLEFLGDGRIAYFVEHPGEGKDKGVRKFSKDRMLPVFEALLRTRTAV